MLILCPSNFSDAPPSLASSQFDWARSANGQQVLDAGRSGASLLPGDDDVVLVLPPRGVSWHRVALPKVPASRLRAALEGLLEDRLLADVNALHFALEPGGRSGRTVWVAVCEKTRLGGWLQVFEAAGRPIGRIVPALWPLTHDETSPLATGVAPGDKTDLPDPVHWAHDDAGQAWLCSASVLGVSSAPLVESPGESGSSNAAGAWRAMAPSMLGHTGENGIWLADPAVAALAERVLDRRFEPVARPRWLMRCAQSDWNLAQFDFSLSAGARRSQRWRRALQQWLSAPQWRPARRGLAALVAVHLVGLNTAAWYERNQLAHKQQLVRQTLQQGFPHVTLVLDAPVQMQRELTRLQQASGALSAGDLETLLGAIDQASGGAPLLPTTLHHTPGEGRLSGWRATEAQLRTLQLTLERSGWRVRLDGGELTINPPGT